MLRKGSILITLLVLCNFIFIISYTNKSMTVNSELDITLYTPTVQNINLDYSDEHLSNGVNALTNQKSVPQFLSNQNKQKILVDPEVISRLSLNSPIDYNENYNAKQKRSKLRQTIIFSKFTMTNESLARKENPSPYEGNIFQWSGNSWRRYKATYSKLDNFRQTTLFTKSGPTPIYIYNPTEDVHISATLLRSGNWETEIVPPLIKILQTDPELSFVDIGANIGVFSLEVAKFGRKVIAVEPLVDNVKRLCAGVKNGNLSELVSIVFNALSSSHSSVLLGRAQNNVGGTFVTKGIPGSIRNKTYFPDTVQTCFLDDLLTLPIPLPRKVVMKIDVEGHEANILQGAHKFFKEVDVKAVIMEWTISSSPSSAKIILEFMNNFSMKPYDLSMGIYLDGIDFKLWPINIIWQKHQKDISVKKHDILSLNHEIQYKVKVKQILDGLN